MNFKKINRLIADKILAADKSFQSIQLGRWQEKLAVLIDGYLLFLLSSEDFIFDCKKLPEENPALSDCLTKIERDKYRQAKITAEKEIKTSKKKTLYQLTNQDTTAYIDKSFAVYFDKHCQYLITGPKSPVLVQEQNRLAGLIMPVNTGDTEKTKGEVRNER